MHFRKQNNLDQEKAMICQSAVAQKSWHLSPPWNTHQQNNEKWKKRERVKKSCRPIYGIEGFEEGWKRSAAATAAAAAAAAAAATAATAAAAAAGLSRQKWQSEEKALLFYYILLGFQAPGVSINKSIFLSCLEATLEVIIQCNICILCSQIKWNEI